MQFLMLECCVCKLLCVNVSKVCGCNLLSLNVIDTVLICMLGLYALRYPRMLSSGWYHLSNSSIRLVLVMLKGTY